MLSTEAADGRTDVTETAVFSIFVVIAAKSGENVEVTVVASVH